MVKNIGNKGEEDAEAVAVDKDDNVIVAGLFSNQIRIDGTLLDADSEAIVTAALERLSSRCTTLVIAHRLATARRADKVVILDGGKIRDTGSHDELRARSELYRRYWELQSLDGVSTG